MMSLTSPPAARLNSSANQIRLKVMTLCAVSLISHSGVFQRKESKVYEQMSTADRVVFTSELHCYFDYVGYWDYKTMSNSKKGTLCHLSPRSYILLL